MGGAVNRVALHSACKSTSSMVRISPIYLYAADLFITRSTHSTHSTHSFITTRHNPPIHSLITRRFYSPHASRLQTWCIHACSLCPSRQACLALCTSVCAAFVSASYHAIYKSIRFYKYLYTSINIDTHLQISMNVYLLREATRC